MNKFFTTTAALLLTTTMAGAGGLDRSGQPISVIFENGNYAELSFGYVMPSVSGIAFGIDSGNMAPDYSQIAGAVKWDINDKLSFAVIVDQAFGATVGYTNPAYPVIGVSTANLNGVEVTALARYKFSDRFSLYGGARAVQMSGDANLSNGTYVADFANDTDVGFVVGGAYEIPDIALLVALTYSSETSFSNDTTVFGTPVAPTDFTMPQSVNLDFQTGVAANTLLFGSIRWADWTATSINPVGYPFNPLVDYTRNVYTYTLGVGRKFNDKFSGSLAMSYESSEGVLTSNLDPTDGRFSVQIGGSYAVADNVKLSGGVRYIKIGDAVTEAIGGVFTDNSAVAIGLKVGYTF